MRNGQRAIRAVGRHEATLRARHGGHVHQAAVRQHHAFRPAGGAARVDQRRALAGAVRVHRFRFDLPVQRADQPGAERRCVRLCSVARAMRGGVRRHLGHIKHAAGAAVGAQFVHLAGRQAGIHGDDPRIAQAGCKHQADQRGAVFADRHHPVAGPDAQRGQPGRRGLHRRPQGTIRNVVAAFVEGRRGGMLHGAFGQHAVEPVGEGRKGRVAVHGVAAVCCAGCRLSMAAGGTVTGCCGLRHASHENMAIA